MEPRLAYLISRYPATSHTFILREVAELRKLGFEIAVASINNPDQSLDMLTAEERAEAETAWYLKEQGVAGAIAALLAGLVGHPAACVRGVACAVKLAGTDIRRLLVWLAYFIEALMLGRWMQRQKLLHLHVHFATPASSVALIASRVFPITFSITVHGPDEFYDVAAYNLVEKIQAARFLCAIGVYARSQLMKLSDPGEWDKIEVTPLGVDPDVFSPVPFRETYDEFEVLCVGRLVPAKGQRVLLHTVQRLRGQGRKVRLRLVGDGPDRASLEAAAGGSASVVFEGSVNQDRIRDLYRQADAFALASFAEGIPVVLMEAMALELPCVTTWITGIPELIRDEVDGLLVGPSDERALAAAISRLMDDSGLRRRLGRAGRARVIEKYNLQPNVARLADVFRKQLGTAEATSAQEAAA